LPKTAVLILISITATLLCIRQHRWKRFRLLRQMLQ